MEFKRHDVVGIITEFIQGDTLDTLVRQNGALSESTTQGFMKQIIDAVTYIHGQLVLHRF